jgi:alpha-tubulin suppressor-like RCC1 family protein
MGVGNTSEHLNTPTEIRTLTGVKAVASGINRSLAVTTDGAVYGWGFNGGGYIGEGGTSPKIIYPAILTNIAAVEMGSGDLFLALSADGKVYVWGINWGGDREKSYTPSQISQSSFNNKRVVAISAGYTHSLALTEDGQVWAWGEYSFGDAEDRTIVKNEAPTLAEGLEKDVTAISGGDNFSVALKTDGTVWAWGEINNSATPVPVSGLSGITAIAVGGQYCMALGSDGKVRVWGSFSSETYDVPKVVALSKVTAIAAGTGRCLAKTSDGKLWAWGDNTYGALGDGTTTSREDPVEVKFE